MLFALGAALVLFFIFGIPRLVSDWLGTKGATPPGTNHRQWTVTTQATAYVTLFDVTDDMGMICECNIKNTEVTNDAQYVLTTQDMHGVETISAGTDALHAANTKLGGAGQFYRRFKVEIRDKIAASHAALVVKMCSVHLGRQVFFTE